MRTTLGPDSTLYPSYISRATTAIERVTIDLKPAPTDIQLATAHIRHADLLCRLALLRVHSGRIDEKGALLGLKTSPSQANVSLPEVARATGHQEPATVAIKTSMIELPSAISLLAAVDVEMEDPAPDIKLASHHIDPVASESNGASIRLNSTPAQTKWPHHDVNRATDRRKAAADDLKTPPLHPPLAHLRPRW